MRVSKRKIQKFYVTFFTEKYVDKHVTLLPQSEQKIRQKILNFHRRISQIPIGAISLGSFLHSNIVLHPKLPFIGPLRIGFLRNTFCLF